MEKLHADIKRVDGPARIPPGTPDYVEKGMRNRWAERQEAQRELRDAMALWAGVGRDAYGRTDSEMYRLFYFKFGGIDVMSACALGKSESQALTEKVRNETAKDILNRPSNIARSSSL